MRKQSEIERLKTILERGINACWPLANLFNDKVKSLEFQIKIDTYQRVLAWIEKIEQGLI